MTLYIAKLHYDWECDDRMLGIFENYEDAKSRITGIAKVIKSDPDHDYMEKLNIYYLEDLTFYITTAQLNGIFYPDTNYSSTIFTAKIWDLIQFTKEELVELLNERLLSEVLSYLPYGFFENQEKIDYKIQDEQVNFAANSSLFGNHDEKYMHFNWRIKDPDEIEFYV